MKQVSATLTQAALKGAIPTKPIPIRVDWLSVYRQLDLMDRRIDVTILELQHARTPNHLDR